MIHTTIPPHPLIPAKRPEPTHQIHPPTPTSVSRPLLLCTTRIPPQSFSHTLSHKNNPPSLLPPIPPPNPIPLSIHPSIHPSIHLAHSRLFQKPKRALYKSPIRVVGSPNQLSYPFSRSLARSLALRDCLENGYSVQSPRESCPLFCWTTLSVHSLRSYSIPRVRESEGEIDSERERGNCIPPKFISIYTPLLARLV